MIKDIVLALALGRTRDPACDYALSVAAAFDAHLSAIGFAYEPILPVVDIGSAIPIELIDKEREINRKSAADAISRFEESARLSAISSDSRVVEASTAGVAQVFGAIARSFDLSVVGQADPQSTLDDLMIEGALFDSGRPVLIVPYIQRAPLKLDCITVGWDGSRNAARAVNDAMPFLIRAKKVEVVTINTNEDKSGDIAGVEITRHLARHHVKVELRRIASPDLDVANTILSDAADRGTDLLVMGGYGHSRLREFVLGGATRGILSSMTVPTLMSH